MKSFFYPDSICITGASKKEKTIGYEILKNLKFFGYKGKIFPVNPGADEILGLKCFHDIDEIEETIELAVVVVQKSLAAGAVEKLLRKGVKALVLITAGFKEIGKDGEEAEKEIIDKVKRAGARIVGPNCMGLITSMPQFKMNSTFIPEMPESGESAFLSQSGAMGAAVLNSIRETGVMFSHFISVGNKADVNENDLLEFWGKDDNIKIITMYLESFERGEELIRLFSEGGYPKPVIILKAGRTNAGMKAALSHTGALGSSDRAVDAVLKQFGIIRVNDTAELFYTAGAFRDFPLPDGNRVAVVTNAGGPGILCVDSIEAAGLCLAEPAPSTKRLIKDIIHPEGSAANPVDLLPGGNAETYKKVIEILLNDENVDSIISIFVEPGLIKPIDVVESVNSVQSPKPALQAVFPRPEFWDEYRLCNIKKYVFRTAEQPAKALANMLFYNKAKNSGGSARLVKNLQVNYDEYLVNGKINAAAILRAYGIPLAEEGYVSYDKLADYIMPHGAVALKALCSKVTHKTEMNAVKLGIASREELLKSAEEMTRIFKAKGFEIDTFLIQPYLKAKFELLMGGFRDKSFGPMIMFGSGGKYVEAYNDTCMKSAYASDEDINKMIEETKIGSILKGFRGEAGADIKAVARVLKSSAQMMLDLPFIGEFDFNPLIVTDEGKLYAVDVRFAKS